MLFGVLVVAIGMASLVPGQTIAVVLQIQGGKLLPQRSPPRAGPGWNGCPAATGSGSLAQPTPRRSSRIGWQNSVSRSNTAWNYTRRSSSRAALRWRRGCGTATGAKRKSSWPGSGMRWCAQHGAPPTRRLRRPQLPETLLLVDTVVDGPLDAAEGRFFLSPDGLVVLVPVPGGHFRVTGELAADVTIDDGTGLALLETLVRSRALPQTSFPCETANVGAYLSHRLLEPASVEVRLAGLLFAERFVGIW